MTRAASAAPPSASCTNEDILRLSLNDAAKKGREELAARVVSAGSARPSGRCEAVVDVAWREPSPFDLKKLFYPNGVPEDVLLSSVIERTRIVLGSDPEGRLRIVSKTDAPRPSWHVTGLVVACEPELIESAQPFEAEDVASNPTEISEQLGQLPVGCTTLPAGTELRPTGAMAFVPKGGPSLWARAYEVLVRGATLWIVPSIDCRKEYIREDGVRLNPIASCSALDLWVLDCTPNEPCWLDVAHAEARIAGPRPE